MFNHGTWPLGNVQFFEARKDYTLGETTSSCQVVSVTRNAPRTPQVDQQADSTYLQKPIFISSRIWNVPAGRSDHVLYIYTPDLILQNPHGHRIDRVRTRTAADFLRIHNVAIIDPFSPLNSQ